MYDDIAEQLNIAIDPNMPETEEIVSIDNPRCNGKTLEFNCTYDIQLHLWDRDSSIWKGAIWSTYSCRKIFIQERR